MFAGHAARDAFWQALAWASLPAGHSVIAGNAVPGATLRIFKDFDLYTATSPPQPIQTHLESAMVVPASLLGGTPSYIHSTMELHAPLARFRASAGLPHSAPQAETFPLPIPAIATGIVDLQQEPAKETTP